MSLLCRPQPADPLLALSWGERRDWRRRQRRAVSGHQADVLAVLRGLAASSPPARVAAGPGSASLLRIDLPGWQIALAGVAPGPAAAVAVAAAPVLRDAGRYGRHWWISLTPGSDGSRRPVVLLGERLAMTRRHPGPGPGPEGHDDPSGSADHVGPDVAEVVDALV